MYTIYTYTIKTFLNHLFKSRFRSFIAIYQLAKYFFANVIHAKLQNVALNFYMLIN